MPDVDDGGVVLGFYTMVIDVTEAKAVEARLKALARLDSLTGLLNRKYSYERLSAAFARNAAGARPHAFISI